MSRGVSGKEGLADPVVRFNFVSQKIRSLKVQRRARRLTRRSAVRSLDRSATQTDFKILGKVSIGRRSVPFTLLYRTSLRRGADALGAHLPGRHARIAHLRTPGRGGPMPSGKPPRKYSSGDILN